MEITAVKFTGFQVPLERPFKYSQAWYKARPSGIVEVETSEGITGIGECYGPPELLQAVVERAYAPALLGRDPFDNEVIWDELYNKLRDHGRKGLAVQAISGIDIALWDIKGKALGMPVYKLLGGAFRTRVRAYATGFYGWDTPNLLDALKREAEQHLEDGFTAMKIKIGFGWDFDRKLIEGVRAAVGDGVTLMADANHAYDVETAIRTGRVLQDNGYYFFEEPVVPEDIDGYIQVKQALPGLIIAGGECEYTRFGHRDLITRRAVGLLQPDTCAAGGITEMKRIIAMANAHHIACVPHVWGTRIAMAASLHVLAATPHNPPGLVPPELWLEFDRSLHPLREKVVNEKISLDPDGFVTIPDRPGIGVTLNRRAFEEFAAYTV